MLGRDLQIVELGDGAHRPGEHRIGGDVGDRAGRAVQTSRGLRRRPSMNSLPLRTAIHELPQAIS